MAETPKITLTVTEALVLSVHLELAILALQEDARGLALVLAHWSDALAVAAQNAQNGTSN